MGTKAQNLGKQRTGQLTQWLASWPKMLEWQRCIWRVSLCGCKQRVHREQTELLPLSTLISPHTDADFLFRYLNPLSHSSMTSSHLLAQRVLQQSAEKSRESRVYRKCDFHVTTNAYTPLHMLSNYPTLFYINSHNLILISL